MAKAKDLLTWESLTAAVNEIKAPNSFLRNRLFGNHQPQNTPFINIDKLIRGRSIAPFVHRGAEAKMTPSYTWKPIQVEAPHIRIKKPFTPSTLLNDRKPGSVILIGAADQGMAIKAHIARDLALMSDDIVNSEEYLCSLTLQGGGSYTDADGEVFTITFDRPAGNVLVLTTFWNDADPTLPDLVALFTEAKRTIHSEVQLPVTDAIMGSEAADHFRHLIATQEWLNKWFVDAGQITMQNQFSAEGALLIGRFCGITVWEYSRTVAIDEAGTTADMIRPKYVEFVAAVPEAENVLYYAGIEDNNAFSGQVLQAERFSKSWMLEDPSVMMALIESNPLPVTRRPGSMASCKVVSG